MYTIMMGYDRNRKEWIDYLYKNKREKSLYTVTKIKMREITFYYGTSCQRCRFIEPKISELCEKNGWKLNLVNAEEDKTDLTSIPMMEVDGDLLDYDGIIKFYMDNNK